MDVRVGLWRKLSAKELMLSTCGVGEDSWESFGLKEIQPVHSEGDQPWDFFGRNAAKAETPVLWPPHAKSWLTGKDPDALVLLGEVNSCGKCQLLRILPVGCSNASQPSFLFSTWSDCWLILRKEFSNLTEHQIHLKGLKTYNPTPKFLNRAWPENLIF